MPDSSEANNSLLLRAQELWRAGNDRNRIVVELLRLNRASASPVPDHQIIELASSFPNQQSVNQEHQENQEFQDEPPNSNESHRGAAPPVLVTERQRQTAAFQEALQRGVDSGLPFPIFMAHAVDEHNRSNEEDCREQWQSQLFYFVRILKLHPELKVAGAKAALRKVEKVLRIWRPSIPKQSAGVGDWEFWLKVCQEDAQAEFLDVWDKVRYLPGYDPLANAMELADKCPLSLNPEIRECRSDGYELFISIAGWLQVGMGDQNILLPVEELAGLLGVQPMTITRYRKWAKVDGYLNEVKAYEFRGKKGGGKATEFRFDVTRFAVLQEKAQKGTAERFAQ